MHNNIDMFYISQSKYKYYQFLQFCTPKGKKRNPYRITLLSFVVCQDHFTCDRVEELNLFTTQSKDMSIYLYFILYEIRRLIKIYSVLPVDLSLWNLERSKILQYK